MRLLSSAFFILSLAVSPAAAEEHDVFGTFLTEDGRTLVKIEDCGDGTPCGSVVWIEPESLSAGETIETVVGKNGEVILNTRVLWGFSRGSRNWRLGKIYDTAKDKTSAVGLKRLDSKRLELTAYTAAICETHTWTLFE